MPPGMQRRKNWEDSFPFYFDPTSEFDFACTDYTILNPRPLHPMTSARLLERPDAHLVVYRHLRLKYDLDPQAIDLHDQLEVITMFRGGHEVYLYTVDDLPFEKGWACDLAYEYEQQAAIQRGLALHRPRDMGEVEYRKIPKFR